MDKFSSRNQTDQLTLIKVQTFKFLNAYIFIDLINDDIVCIELKQFALSLRKFELSFYDGSFQVFARTGMNSFSEYEANTFLHDLVSEEKHW